MKQSNNQNLIIAIPVIILLVAVGTLTKYNLFYTTIAGALGGSLGYFLSKYLKKNKK